MNEIEYLNMRLFKAIVILICIYLSLLSAAWSQPDNVSLAEQRRKLPKIDKQLPLDLNYLLQHVPYYPETHEVDPVIQMAEDTVKNLEATEGKEIAPGVVFTERTNYHLYAYSILAGAYAKKGYCFHSYYYYYKYMELKNPDLLHIGLWRGHFQEPSPGNELYEFFRNSDIATSEHYSIPIKRCISRADSSLMFTRDSQ